MAAAPKAQELNTWDLKSLYFVEDLTGNPQHQECKEFDPGQRPIGRKIQVIFKDGETMVGPPRLPARSPRILSCARRSHIEYRPLLRS